MSPKTKSKRKRLNMRGGIKTAIQSMSALGEDGEIFLKVYSNSAETGMEEIDYLKVEIYSSPSRVLNVGDYINITVSLNEISDNYLFDSDEAGKPTTSENTMYVKLSAGPHADQFVPVNQIGGGRRHDTITLKIKKVDGHECEHPLYRETRGGFFLKKKKKRTHKL